MVSSVELKKWRIYCITEEDWSEGWIEDGSSPDKCFNSGDHEINPNSLQVISRSNILSLEVKEEQIKTGGHIKSEGFTFTIPANTSQTNTISWPIPINVINLTINSVKEEIGNVLNSVVSPNTAMGVLSAESVIGESEIYVSDTVIANAYIGLEILINGNLVAEILSINSQTKTLSLSKNLEAIYPIGSVVGGQRRIVKNYNLGFNSAFTVGAHKIGTSYLKANTDVSLEYDNNTDAEQKLTFNVEYLY